MVNLAFATAGYLTNEDYLKYIPPLSFYPAAFFLQAFPSCNTQSAIQEGFPCERFEIPEYTAYRTTGPIVIDGQPDEAAWQEAPRSPRFRDLVSGEETRYDTRAAVSLGFGLSLCSLLGGGTKAAGKYDRAGRPGLEG
jgi:hypothetical protein